MHKLNRVIATDDYGTICLLYICKLLVASTTTLLYLD